MLCPGQDFMLARLTVAILIRPLEVQDSDLCVLLSSGALLQ